MYVYKGLLDKNIDYNWSGTILVEYKKIVDEYTKEMAFSQLQKTRLPSILYLISIHHMTTRKTVTHTIKVCLLQVLVIVDGPTASLCNKIEQNH